MNAETSQADVGSALKSARLRKGYSLETVAQQTRIPKKHLEALEHNRLEEFPAPAYLRGFLKGYCDYLEVEFEPLWQKISAKTSAPSAPKESPAPTVLEPPAAAAPKLRVDASAAAAILLALVLACFLALWVGHSRQEPENRPAPPAALEPIGIPHLVIETRDEVWLSLSLDGSPRFEGRVPRGVRQEWKGRSITLKTTNPQALVLSLNGSPYSLPPADAADRYHIESP